MSAGAGVALGTRTGTESAGTCRLFWIPIQEPALAAYAHALSLPGPEAALAELARAIASTPTWRAMPPAVLVARPGPPPGLAVFGRFEDAEMVSIRAQARAVNAPLRRVRYVPYRRAEEDCRALAEQIAARYSREAIRRFGFTAIPRGGQIVLGMLAYALGLERDQLLPPYPPDAPLVVVDDCAVSAARFLDYLPSWGDRQILFVTLYSPPALREAIVRRHPCVAACLSAHDLHDHAPALLGDAHPGWLERSKEGSTGPRYWVGIPDHLAFPWGEYNRVIRNPATGHSERGWRLVPPALCLKNRPAPGEEPVPVQVQPVGRGPLQPAGSVLFAETAGQVVVGSLAGVETIALAGVAADMWRAVLAHGSREGVIAALLGEYDVQESELRRDVDAFVRGLLERGLLEEARGGR